MDNQQREWVLENLDHAFKEMREGLASGDNDGLFQVEPSAILESIGTLGNNAVAQVLNSPFDPNVWRESAAQARDIMIFGFLLAVQFQYKGEMLGEVLTTVQSKGEGNGVKASDTTSKPEFKTVETKDRRVSGTRRERAKEQQRGKGSNQGRVIGNMEKGRGEGSEVPGLPDFPSSIG